MPSSENNPYADCHTVSPSCPLSSTVYQYQPSLGANAFFLAFFALCAILQLLFGLKYRTWTFLVALVLGSACEAIGYIGRVMLHFDPWTRQGFELQIICLIIAPAFIAAGVYLSLKHFVLFFGPEFSLLKPRLYTWIFIGADIFSLVLQGAGGGITASTQSESLLKTGEDIAVAGIVWQVLSLVIFGVLGTEYAVRVYRNREKISPETWKTAKSVPFRIYCVGIVVAYLTILTRCAYRIPELAGGWRNSVMLNETLFIVLDGVMMTLAVAALTIAHPGFCFKPLSKKYQREMKQIEEKKRVDSSQESLA